MNGTDGTDCAWCGTGEGICAGCLQAIFTQSDALAATGLYLAPNSEENVQPQTAPTESEVERHAAA